MEILNLKNLILNKSLPDFYIFTGRQVVRDMYLEQIELNFNTKILNNVNDYIKIQLSKIKEENIIYIIYNDEDFLNNSESWSFRFKNLILVYDSITKSSKFYKYWEQSITDFPWLDNTLLKGLLENRLNIKESDIDYLMLKCNNDYYKCLNEADKIDIFDRNYHQQLFDYMKRDNSIGFKDKIESFTLSNAFLDKDKIAALTELKYITKEDCIGQLTLIYNQIKNLLRVKGGKSSAEMLNMNPKVYYIMSKKNTYTIEQMTSILLYIIDSLNDIKMGEADAYDVLNILIIKFM